MFVLCCFVSTCPYSRTEHWREAGMATWQRTVRQSGSYPACTKRVSFVPSLHSSAHSQENVDETACSLAAVDQYSPTTNTTNQPCVLPCSFTTTVLDNFSPLPDYYQPNHPSSLSKTPSVKYKNRNAKRYAQGRGPQPPLPIFRGTCAVTPEPRPPAFTP